MASMITTAYDAALNLVMQALQMNVLPDFLLRWGVRQLLKERLKEISKPTLEGQLQDLLAFVECTCVLSLFPQTLSYWIFVDDCLCYLF